MQNIYKCDGSFRRGTACAIIAPTKEYPKGCARCIAKNYTPAKKALAIAESKVSDAKLPLNRVKPKGTIKVEGLSNQVTP